MKRTKIVCTIGPASQEAATLKKMIAAGMNVARLNFSHGTHRSHAKIIKTLRRVAAQAGEPLALLGDLQGPKIRLGELPKEGVLLKKGETIRFSTGVSHYRAGGPLPVTYKRLHRDVKRGHRFLIDDGLLALTITKVQGRTIVAKVVDGGLVTSHKGMNFPDSTLAVSPITDKDRADAIFGVQQGVDWIALSFVTSAKNILALRQIIKKAARRGQVRPRIIVKIEKHEAIDNFDEILSVVDGVMIARGDLGVEIPAEEVPVRQREIIEKCRLAGKPVVVATQMLDSMIRNPRATRAEVSDVAHAVFDHTDAVMLSGESASGQYPVAAVQLMGKIVQEAEASPFDDVPLTDGRSATHAQSVAVALKVLAMGGHLDGVIVFQKNAPWAEAALLMHPEIPLFLVGAKADVLRANNLRWGVRPVVGRGSVRQLLGDLKDQKLIRGRGKIAIIGEVGQGFGFRLIDL